MSSYRVYRSALLQCFVVAWVLGTAVCPATAKPFDRQAIERLERLKCILSEKVVSNRRIEESETRRLVESLSCESSDRRTCALLLLGFAADAQSGEALRRFTASPAPILAGAAQAALAVRSASQGDPADIWKRMVHAIQQSTNEFARLFLINRTFVDHASEPERKGVLLDLAKAEKYGLPKTELLFWLACEADAQVAREALQTEWSDSRALPENIGFLLKSITPGQPQELSLRSPHVLVARLEEKAGR